MKSDAIVITFDVAKGFTSRLSDILKYAVFNQFRLEARKETLRLSVVITITFGTDTLPEAVFLQQLSISVRDILRTSVGMNNGVRANQSVSQSHL